MPSTNRTPSRRQFLAILATLFGITTLAIGVYGLAAGPSTDAPSGTLEVGDGAVHPRVPAPWGSRASEERVDPAGIRSIREPQAFADAVARALFDWSTVGSTPLSEYAGRLLAVADPTGYESAGLMTDIAVYLPTLETWHQLRPYATRQWIEIESVDIPAAWERAVTTAGPGGFATGTTALTVVGQRHRAGVWEGDAVHSTNDVAFTVFMVCQPTYPTCRLLRLSRLNEPLD